MIRQLSMEDRLVFERMETGIDDDYILRIFERLVNGNHRLFGMFEDERLVSVGGFTIFADQYAMVGRLRSDLHYRGRAFATTLMKYLIAEAFREPNVQWVGGNTQSDNLAAQRVLENAGLSRQTSLTNATASSISTLIGGGETWHPISDSAKKMEWIETLYIKEQRVFPLECYYPFPATTALFKQADLHSWRFFKSASKDRIVILKNDQKGIDYLHMIYPWADLWHIDGLWETVALEFQAFKAEEGADSALWLDLTEEQKIELPQHYPFDLPSPWLLYGRTR